MSVLTSNRLKCLFGFHTYTLPHIKFNAVFVCPYCLCAAKHMFESFVEWWTWTIPGQIIQYKDKQVYKPTSVKDPVRYKSGDGSVGVYVEGDGK